MNGTTQKVFTILLVEDNGGDVEMFLRTVEEELPREDDEQVDLVLAARAEGALAILDERRIDLVITDHRLPGMSGIELLRRIQARDRRIPVIIISWVNTVDTAVEAMRCGAFDYVTKPFEKLDFAARIHRAMRISEILFRYEPPQGESLPFKELVGVSPAFQKVTAMIDAAARVQSTTLIIGETGTGKELIARAIHERSAERNGPFQVVDCTTFSEGTVESELFGHVRGAFTDAKTDRVGRFELADGGTLFLDEIGTVPLSLQSKLLRVLQTGDVERVGSSKARHVDVRIISATNANLQQEVAEGRFREDLLFRLNTIEVNLPPLRDRREDIPALAAHFLRRHAKRYHKTLGSFDAGGMQALLAHGWPGNIRELDHAIERAVLMAQGDQVRASDLGLRAAASTAVPRLEELPLEDVEKMLIQKALSRYDGNVSRAAQALGLSRSALYRRIASHGL